MVMASSPFTHMANRWSRMHRKKLNTWTHINKTGTTWSLGKKLLTCVFFEFMFGTHPTWHNWGGGVKAQFILHKTQDSGRHSIYTSQHLPCMCGRQQVPGGRGGAALHEPPSPLATAVFTVKASWRCPYNVVMLLLFISSGESMRERRWNKMTKQMAARARRARW